MSHYGSNGSSFSIKFACPSGSHGIEIECRSHTVVLVPQRCPSCGMGLPGAYRMRVREILNITRFQNGQNGSDVQDIEIISA